MFLAQAQLTNKAFTDAGKGRIRQSLTALVIKLLSKGVAHMVSMKTLLEHCGPEARQAHVAQSQLDSQWSSGVVGIL